MAKSNDNVNTTASAIPAPLIERKAAPDAVIKALDLAVDQAQIGASWANDRIDPMIKAIIGLADFTHTNADMTNDRLKLVRKLALETSILVDDMAGGFEREARELIEKRVGLEGGAA